MNKINLIIILTLSIVFSSCTEKTKKRNNEISRIVFATGGCYGHCPIQVIDIDSSLNFKYQGLEYSKYIGYYEGSFKQELWDSLNIELEKLNYNELDTIYSHSVDDLSTEIYIYNKNGIKHIYAQSSSLPKNVENFYEWFLERIQKLEMKNTNKKFIFQTTTEKPIPEPDYFDTEE